MGDIRRTVGAVIVLGLVTGCSLVGGDANRRNEPAATVTITASPQSDTDVAASPAASPVEAVSAGPSEDRPAGSLPSGVGEYADAFVRAWGIGDRPAAAQYASADAVASLFQYDGRGGSTWKRESALVQGSRTQVRYTDGTGASLYVVVDNATVTRGAAGAIVGANVEWDDIDNTYNGDWGDDDGVDWPAAPAVATGLVSTSGEYADALVRAWGVGDWSGADVYATDAALTTMFGTYTSGGSRWRRTSATSSSATYANDDGTRLTLSLDPATVSAGRGDGVYAATFS